MKDTKIRLFVDQALSNGQTLSLSAGQAQYLYAVMRQRAGDAVRVFNGLDGEWRAQIETLGKRNGVLRAAQQLRVQTTNPDVWLCFAPLKKARMDMVVEKATELGVTRLAPVITEYTNSERLRLDRMQAQAVEAAEQCGALTVPKVDQPKALQDMLKAWPDGRALVFCDEALAGQSGVNFAAAPAPAAILVGPEGGFAPKERAQLAGFPGAVPVALGPRILRAETAALAALALWHAQSGAW